MPPRQTGGDDNRKRDLVPKRRVYARAGIREYWIVDPRERLITVLALAAGEYVTAGEYRPGSAAVSGVLGGFSVDLAKLLEQ
jgi:Uma2 family endonuclease